MQFSGAVVVSKFAPKFDVPPKTVWWQKMGC